MYKLYGSPLNRAARVIWMLEEVGAAYELIAALPHDEAIRSVNPTGKIPALVDGETAVFDSTAILMYLADKHGALTYPLGSAARARMTSVIGFAIDSVEQPLWTMAKHGFVLPEDLRLGDALTPACHFEWEKAMATLDQILGDQTYVMGEDFTVPDIILGHLGGWGKSTGFPAPPARVADYMKRVRARPGWRAVIAARKD